MLSHTKPLTVIIYHDLPSVVARGLGLAVSKLLSVSSPLSLVYLGDRI
ncbi:hypothetical protein OSCI_2570014 [Kamptonema sp. PCC 6506]|nr:hypothetical protein OSCI_2570014 [Kamptonema sp. PCC 6506]